MNTIKEIKADDNLLCGLEIPEYNLSAYLTYTGGSKVKYDVFRNGELLFSGNDYRPSPLYSGIDSIESICGLLDFICTQAGDVEADYFKHYTGKQLEWRESKDCEDLKYILLDFSNDSNEPDEIETHKNAVEFMQQRFIQ